LGEWVPSSILNKPRACSQTLHGRIVVSFEFSLRLKCGHRGNALGSPCSAVDHFSLAVLQRCFDGSRFSSKAVKVCQQASYAVVGLWV